jgi:hypothetical protein
LCLRIPPYNQSQTKGLTIDEPFHFKFGALLLGKLRDDGWQIAILAGCEPLAICTMGLEDTGLEMGFAPDNKAAAMVVNVSPRGEIELTPVGQAQIAPQTLWLRTVVVFGIGIRTQRNGEGGVLE